MSRGKPFVPQHDQGRHDELGHGPWSKYLQYVDEDDPARLAILRIFRRYELTGIALTEESVNIAIKLGQHEYHEDAVAFGKGRREIAELQTRWKDPHPHIALDPGIVYYLLKQRLIKIGVTSKPLQRFTELMPDAILAVEPGNEDVERARHAEFRELQSSPRSEYFFAAPVLVNHIKALREEHGVPNYPFRSLIPSDESEALVRELFAL